MKHLLSTHDIQAISQLTRTLQKPEIEHLVSDWKHLKLKSSELPMTLRSNLISLLYEENEDDFLVISGFPILDEQIGETPLSWQERSNSDHVGHFELYMQLCAAFLGEPFSWATQQDGHIIHEVLPMKEHEFEQLGFSSSTFLELHTEDAFHEHRADFLLLGCLRNTQEVPTIISSISWLNLPKIPHLEELFKPQFSIKPDKSHLGIASSNLEEDLSSFEANKRMLSMNEQPTLVSVLFGPKDRPYVRADDVFLEEPEYGLAKEALAALTEAFQDASKYIPLAAGDLLIVDNYRALHGRASFKAKYNGKDRWLKRVNISNNLRNYRGYRMPGSRIVV